MDQLPEKPNSSSEPASYEPIDAEVVDAEIVGAPRKPSWWRRLLARAAFALVLAVFGAGFLVAGVLLTLTIVGAALGIPLALIGLVLIVAAVIVLIGGGRIAVIRPPFR